MSKLSESEEKFKQERDPEILLGDRRHPKGWKSMSLQEKYEFIATRRLAEDRQGVTSHSEIKETGILSISQYERRLGREVYSELGSLDTVAPKPGVFHRVHVRDLRGVRNVESKVQKTKETNE